jgi:AAA domain
MEFYEDVFTCHQDGDWFVSSICPAIYEGPDTERKHEHSTKTGFRFDGTTSEFHCFAGGCAGNEMSFGQIVKHLNQYHEKFAGRIWEEEPIEEILRTFNVDNEDETPSPGEARSSCAAAAEERSDEAGKNEAEEHVLVGKLEDDNIYVAVTNMGRVVPKPLEWMWDQRLLRYHLNLFAGKPEKCKTLAALEMAAILTTGRDWPDGRKNELGPRTVLIMMSEDGLEDVIWGRLTAAGADLNRVEAIKGVIIGEEMRKKKKKRLMALKNDIVALRSLVRKYPDAAMIIIDPISSYYGCNANKVEEVKPVLDSLKELCEESRIAILAVAHTNKRSDVDALQQVSGDTSVGGSFRSGWTFSDDPDKEDEYLMSNNKGNHAKDKSGLRLRPVGVSIRFPDNTEHDYPRVEWLGKSSLRAQDVQDKQRDNAKNGNSSRKIDAAKSLLLMKFAQSPQHKCTELYDEAEKEGISADTMKRARIQLLESRELVIDVDDRRGRKTASGGYCIGLRPSSTSTRRRSCENIRASVASMVLARMHGCVLICI